ncbi:MAG: nucleoside deaminase [Desulfobulbaceae bacterium]|nr:nucleoside deaminase [Desulfobulbaceae bacterium]
MKDHQHFMRLALADAEKALGEGEFPVACVFVSGGKVVARAGRKNSSGDHPNEIDHAEVCALRHLLRAAPETDCSRITVYSTMEPCLMCYATMLLSGIRSFVWAYEDVMGGGTNLPLGKLNKLYAEMRVEIVPRVLRRESLALFQEFFRCHSYLHNTLLAEYTLAQTPEKDS